MDKKLACQMSRIRVVDQHLLRHDSGATSEAGRKLEEGEWSSWTEIGMLTSIGDSKIVPTASKE